MAQVVNIPMLLAMNQPLAEAYRRGEQWAVDHISRCQQLNDGNKYAFERKFDGKPRKWCGASCPFEEGCICCNLDENHEVARSNRRFKSEPPGAALQAMRDREDKYR